MPHVRQYQGVNIETNVDSKVMLRALKDAVYAGLKQAMEGPILEDAKANSPVGHEHKPGEITNRESIKVKTIFSKRGPMGKLFSTSGHGGFLEFGTRFMGAQPWCWPAGQKNIGTVIELVRASVAAAQGPEGELITLGAATADKLLNSE